ncbi:CDP-glycerol glycerophosphotransferase family protein, partial [Staphylococcus epidermidis]|nr:CDP-glycerol glycerophosphotransferase family protein [Staphylococcus epidermidis]
LKYLPENYEIIVKLHPNESHLRTRYNQIDNRIHCYFNELVDIQELYILSECMITDYSSTIFDYIHLNKPVFILQEDEQQYKQSVGFYFDLFEVGDFLKASLNEHMLAKQICSTDYINYSKVVHRLMKQDSSKSSEKLMAEILGEPEYPSSSNCKQQIS